MRVTTDPCEGSRTADDGAAWCRCFFWCWLVARTALWAVATTLSYANAPLDLIEWLAWGHALEWGYPKHPPLPGWLAALFARLSPGDVWGVYLGSYAMTAGCLWAAWRLGREYLPPRHALLAALALDGLMHLTNGPAEFNNNIALNLGWAVLVVCLHRAVYANSLRWWFGAGVAAGLTLLCKYTVVVLAAPLLLYLVVSPRTRGAFRGPGPYLAVAVAVAITTPHWLWLARNDFITLRYASDRTAELASGWVRHLQNPLIFLALQALSLLPVVVILLPALRRANRAETRGDLGFLHAAVLGPVALLALGSLVTGRQLRLIWSSPLWTFAGVWALAAWQARHGLAWPRTALRPWAAVAVGALILVNVRVVLMPHLSGRPTRAQFPGPPLAAEVDRRWRERFDGAVPIVGGEPWAAGNVCCYLPHHPVIYSTGWIGYFSMEPAATPWTSDAEVNRRGGALVWNAVQDGPDLPAGVRERFPAIEVQAPITLPYQTAAGLPLARVGLAFVPPDGR